MKIFTHLITLLIGIGIGFAFPIFQAFDHASFRPKSSTLSHSEELNRISEVGRSTPTPESKSALSTKTHPNSAATKGTLTPQEEFENALSDGDFVRAESLIHDISKVSADSSLPLEDSGRLLMRQRKWEEAKVALKYCLTQFPQSHSCLIDLTGAELQVGSKEDQSKTVSACLEAYPKDPQCRNIAAIVRMNEGKFPEAISIYEKLIQENGSFGFRFDEGMLYWQLGIAQEGAGKVKEASDSFYKSCQGRFPGACQRYDQVRAELK